VSRAGTTSPSSWVADDDYVTKPFSPQLLRERVQAVLGR
jgi:DNA-binding response OmpR family regulator